METATLMPKDTTITARVDSRVKAKAKKVLTKVGMTPSEAFNLFLHQVILHGGLPFDVRIPNKETRAAIAELDAGKGERHTGSTREIFDRIIKSDE